jgi:NAD(P)-dependent dehydrogenase (short-subunit alcohol dehydrogenase family)
LRREIAPFGVQVVVVEPGAVRTEMAGRAIATAHELASTMTPEQSQRYGGLVQAITTQTASFTKSGASAGVAAKVIAKAVTARKPRIRYTIGRDAALLTRLTRHASCPTGYSTSSLPLCVPTFPRRANEHHDSATARR